MKVVTYIEMDWDTAVDMVELHEEDVEGFADARAHLEESIKESYAERLAEPNRDRVYSMELSTNKVEMSLPDMVEYHDLTMVVDAFGDAVDSVLQDVIIKTVLWDGEGGTQ